jgi:N-acetylglucosaminyl-diphospho-decaprenol L-rhamnosyltransferase
VKVSVVIICWNDLGVLPACLRSLAVESSGIAIETILADNGSTDGSVEFVKREFPDVQVVENERNLGYGPGNNQGISRSKGDYVLILNPDTVLLSGALKELLAFADSHPTAGAFGCHVENPDGSYQISARKLPIIGEEIVSALGLRALDRFISWWPSGNYSRWFGDSIREIGWHSGCCLLVRGALLREHLKGFDERFKHQYEDADLCHRVWSSGHSILFCPSAKLVHIGGQNRGNYPIPVLLETQRSKYRYFHKHFGIKQTAYVRWLTMLGLAFRYVTYGCPISRKCGARRDRVKAFKLLIKWHWCLNPERFIATGEEPDIRGGDPSTIVSNIRIGAG